MKLFEQDAMVLGESLRQWRMIRDLSAAVVAERAGITTSTLRSIERGEGQKVRLGALIAVVRVLGIEKGFYESLDPMNTELGRLRAARIHRKRAAR